MNTLDYIVEKYRVTNLRHVAHLPYTRYGLSALFYELGYRVGAEIGVHRGAYSKVLCESNPGLKLYCIDIWDDVYKSTGQARPGRDYEIAKEVLAGYACELIKKSSMEAVKDFVPGSLDFVYVDADHAFGSVLEDVTEWSKIVRIGGIVGGHDYKCYKHEEVSSAVSGAVKMHMNSCGIETLFVFAGDRSTSWLYVK